MKILKVKTIFKLFKKAFKTFVANDPLRLGGATAFFTIFALPPILLIMISILGFIFKDGIVSGELYDRLKEIVGENGASQVFSILENIHDIEQNWLITIGGFIFLIFIATTLFNVIHNSLNQLWKIRLKSDQKVLRVLKIRLKSFSIIMFGGLLFVASLIADTLLVYTKDYLVEVIPQLDSFLIQSLRRVITFVILTIWLSTVFKYLADAKIPWKPVWVGAFVTAILFTLGEMILGLVLVDSGIDNIYGTAAAIVLVLLFVFYSSFILYFGASFTKCYAEEIGSPIEPAHFATKFKIQDV